MAKVQRLKTSKLTRIEGDMMISLYLTGYRPWEIAEQVRRGYQTVIDLIEDRGYKSCRYSYSEDDAARWEKMYLGHDDFDEHCIREISEAESTAKRKVGTGRITSALLRRGCRIRHPALGIKIAARKRRERAEGGGKRRKGAHLRLAS